MNQVYSHRANNLEEAAEKCALIFGWCAFMVNRKTEEVTNKLEIAVLNARQLYHAATTMHLLKYNY